MSHSYLGGPVRRRVVPLIAVGALVAGALVASWGGGSVGAAPASTAAKPVQAKVSGLKDVRSDGPRVKGMSRRAAEPGRATTSGLPARGPVAVLLELDTAATADTYRSTLRRGSAAAQAAARGQLSRVRSRQASVAAAVPQVAPKARILYRSHTLVAGLAVQTDVRHVAALQQIAGVKAVYPISTKHISNAAGVPLIGAPSVWETTGNLGEDVTVGVIDSGIDYTHANFGGPGTPEAFAAIDRTHAVPGQFPTAKVIGGFDFAGDDYNANPFSQDPNFPFQPVPHPDPNPIDCKYNGLESNVGHGSHVAGTLTGLGVAADGSTYTGPYDTTTPFSTMRIGPGVAPKAATYALRVFGCAGSTNVLGNALDFAADPDGDGDPSDRLDVINMSLGSDFGSPEDGDTVTSNRLAQLGTVVVASIGNGADVYDVGGSPGNGQRVLGVAGSDDGVAVFDALRVNSPASVDGDYAGLLSVLYDYDTKPGVTDDLAVPLSAGNEDGCDPFSPADAAKVAGKIAFLAANGFTRCGSVGRTNNAQASGAVGVVIHDDGDGLETGINGNPNIPAILVGESTGDLLEPQLATGVNVTFGGETQGLVKRVSPQDADKVYSSSSRGIRRPGNLKPDVAAVAVNTFSTAVGSGGQGKTLSGTSMASPMVAGLAALVRQRHPDWTPEEVKANIMNTAGQDVFVGDNHTGARYAPGRVGAGRVQAPAALRNQVLAYVLDDPGAVSVSFGPVAPLVPTTLSKKIRVVNKGTSTRTYNLSYEPVTVVPGVIYSVTPASVTLTARGVATAMVTMSIPNPTALAKRMDPTMEAEQLGVPRQFLAEASGRVLLSSAGQPTLRVPVYSAPRPPSAMRGPSQVNLPAGSITTGTMPLTGSGVNQGAGAEQVRSLVTGVALQATSAALPTCTASLVEGCVFFPDERGADVRYLGAVTNGPALGSAVFTEGTLNFGMSMWGPWRTPQGLFEFDVLIDKNRDGLEDAVLFTTRVPDTDLIVTQLFDFDLGDFAEDADGNNAWPVNQVFGDVDTALFDSDSIVLTVPVSALAGVDATHPRFNYGLATFSGYHGEPLDLVGIDEDFATTLTLDVRRPSLTATDGTSDALLFAELPGTTLVVRKDVTTFRLDKPRGLLLIHHHNLTGARAQVVKVKQPSAPQLGLSRSTASFGQDVRFVATIPDTAGAPRNGAVSITTSTGRVLMSTTLGVSHNGQWSRLLPHLARGTYTLHFNYGGNDFYLPGRSAGKRLTIT